MYLDTADLTVPEWREVAMWLAGHGIDLPVGQVTLLFTPDFREVTVSATVPVQQPIPTPITTKWFIP